MYFILPRLFRRNLSLFNEFIKIDGEEEEGGRGGGRVCYYEIKNFRNIKKNLVKIYKSKIQINYEEKKMRNSSAPSF